MECVQVTGFGSDPAQFTDDDLFVDQLLDFSNDFNLQEPEPEEEEPQKELEKNCSVPEKTDVSSFGLLPETELSIPTEGLESLEWLSHFVEDSFSNYSLTCTPAKAQPCFSTPVQTKARTKRARTGIRAWPIISPSSSTSSSSSSFLFQTKKQKKQTGDAGQARRCSHCGVTKTPQWRAGPLGAKTLCNACGVRFKSGRLLPEYRPACSPTFSSDVHSNNHRKVLEMRRKKEPGGDLVPPV